MTLLHDLRRPEGPSGGHHHSIGGLRTASVPRNGSNGSQSRRAFWKRTDVKPESTSILRPRVQRRTTVNKKISYILVAATAASLLISGASSLLAQSGNALGKVGLTCTPDQLKDKALGMEKTYLETFDTLDFDVFTNQKWDRLKESHAKNVIVHWPDGHQTQGIDVHIKDLKSLFVYAPDTRILEHPVRIACGDLTAVTGVFEGTFTKPMPLGDGKSIAPTGKAFKIPMATIGRWENGVMAEEFLFWDNQTYAKQIGLTK
jgi:SnoaL-like polyketide cyclase